MPTRRSGSMITADTNAIADRAGWFLGVNTEGEHQAKRIARIFGCSVEMARVLRAGRGWTADRLGQAARAFGKPFIDFVFSDAPLDARPFSPSLQLAALNDRLARIEARLEVQDAPPPAFEVRPVAREAVASDREPRRGQGGAMGADRRAARVLTG